MTESEWQAMVIELAHATGWTVAHFRPAKTAHGWRTPVQADGAGWPDLVLARGPFPGRVLFRELKSDTGRLRPDQEAWLELLEACGQDTGVWRPRDWDELVIPALTRRR